MKGSATHGALIGSFAPSALPQPSCPAERGMSRKRGARPHEGATATSAGLIGRRLRPMLKAQGQRAEIGLWKRSL